jgi:glycosyltransferase involved in cell wall biosynthesis
VLPSRREGLSNALLEAMASGLPCIANDIPPNREVLDGGRAGLLVPVEDEEALLKALRGLVTDADNARMWGKRARDRVISTYTIDAVAARYDDLYHRLNRQ